MVKIYPKSPLKSCSVALDYTKKYSIASSGWLNIEWFTQAKLGISSAFTVVGALAMAQALL